MDGEPISEFKQKQFEFLKSRTEPEEVVYFDIRFTHSLFLLRLQNAGLQFGINDITIDEFFWLGDIKNAINEYQIEEQKQKVKNGKK